MNKKVGLFLTALVLSSLLIGFVSADPLTDGVKKVGTFLGDAIKFIIGSSDQIAGYTITAVLIAKLLLLIILFSIIWSVLEFMPFMNQGWTRWTLSIIVSILGIRFLTDELIATIILPYSVLAVAMTAIIPFIIYFLFVERGISSSTGRKLAWIFFGAVFVSLWAYRMGYVGNATGSMKLGDTGYIYLVTALAALVMILMDRTVHAWFTRAAMERIADAGRSNELNIINEKISWARKVITTVTGDPLPIWALAAAGIPAPGWAAGNKTQAMNSSADRYIKDQERAIKAILK